MKREDRAFKDILAGREPEKKVVVTVGDLTPEGKQEEEERKERISKIMQHARRPWWCPTCGGTMKSKLDDKMWNLHGKCFSCVVEEETKLRIEGNYEKYEHGKIHANKVAFLKDMEQLLVANLEALKNPEFVTELGEVERWSGVDLETVESDMREHLEQVRELLEDNENGGVNKPNSQGQGEEP